MIAALVDTATVIDDRYRVLRSIGSGTMGAVYEVEHIGFGRRLAMKVLHSQANRIESLRRRFEREAYSAGKLDDPRIVDVTDVGQLPDGRPYIIMALIEGTSLTEAMSNGPMSVPKAVGIARGILEALSHAHERGVIHRDLKPDNVMLVPTEPSVKLLDFGLARLVAPEQRGPLTRSGAVFGTPRYMAPEQAMGEAAEPRSDLYSVGILLHEMITGSPLFPSETALEAMQQQMSTVPPKLEVPPDPDYDAELLSFVVDKALKKQPTERFQDAHGFIGALDTVMMPQSRFGWWPWAAGVAAVMLVAGAGLLMLDPAPPPAQTIDLSVVQEAVRAGAVTQASAAAEAMVNAYPQQGETWLAVALARRANHDDPGSTEALIQALRLDPGLADHPVLRSMVRNLVGASSEEVSRLLDELKEVPHREWLPLVTELAQTARRPSERRQAWEVLERLDDFGTLDPFAYLSEQLARNRTGRCQIRQWYIERLIRLDDERTRTILEGEMNRPRRQWVCMDELIQTAMSQP